MKENKHLTAIDNIMHGYSPVQQSSMHIEGLEHV